MKRKCKCEVCRRHTKLRALIRMQKSERAKKYIYELGSELDNVEMDEAFWRLKYHGQWEEFPGTD